MEECRGHGRRVGNTETGMRENMSYTVSVRGWERSEMTNLKRSPTGSTIPTNTLPIERQNDHKCVIYLLKNLGMT